MGSDPITKNGNCTDMVMRIQGRKLERVSKVPVVNYLLAIIKIFLSTVWIILICFDKMKVMNECFNV